MIKPWWAYKSDAVARRLHARTHDEGVEDGRTVGHRVNDSSLQASAEELEEYSRAALKLAKHNQKAGNGPTALARVQDVVAELVRRLHVADSHILYLHSQVRETTGETNGTEGAQEWHFEDGSRHAGYERFEDGA